MEEKSVDIIIPVYKPDKKLELLLARLEKQTKKPSHIFLLHTTDNTPKERTVKWKNIKNLDIIPIEKEEFDHGSTRNYGISLSKASYLLLLTQDAVPVDTHLIERLVNTLSDEKIAVAYGRQLARKNAGIIEQYTRLFNYPDKNQIKSKLDLNKLGIKTYFCSNVCAMYSSKIYHELGGFVKKTIFNEDMIFAAKVIEAGYKIAYVSEAKVIHSHQYNYKEQFTRNFDLGVSQKQYKEIFENIHSESEGKKLIRCTIDYLEREKKFYLIPDLILQSGFKYLGYKLGKQYEKLPEWFVIKCSMNKGYWGKERKDEQAFK